MPNVIAGAGLAAPPNVVTNADLARIMDTDDEWVRSRTGVVSRRFVEPGIGSSDLAVEAARAALDDAGVHPGQVDAVITATMTPDHQNPGIVGLVQDGLGVPTVAGYDLRQQCCGFLYGLDLADMLLDSGRATTVVLVGAEVHAGYFPWEETWDIALGRSHRLPTPEEWERNTRSRAWTVLFGDGAGAVVLKADPDPGIGILASSLHTDGSLFGLIEVPGLGSIHRPYAQQAHLSAGLHLPRMDGAGLYRQAVRLMPEAIVAVTEKAGLSLADIDVVVAHQANERILAGVVKQLGVDADLVPSNIARWGNTTAATLPILYSELRESGRIAPGSLVCFAAFGAGAHWGALLYREPATGARAPHRQKDLRTLAGRPL